MYNHESFTKKANMAINRAFAYAEKLGHTYVGSEHLLLGLLSDGTAFAVLRNHDVTEEKVRLKLIELIGKGNSSVLARNALTPTACLILETAMTSVRGKSGALAGTEHILMAILRETSCSAVEILRDLGCSPTKIYSDCTGACLTGVTPASSTEIKLPTLSKYGRDLTYLASNGQCDPIIGREKEIEQVVQTLSRRTKNNPCLIGEAGVGKTAVAEGIARLLAENKVPEILSGKHLFSLDLTAILAGAKYRGDFEERIKNCIDEVVKSGEIILFIDEIHSIVGAGAAEGAIDAANILKPRLARGELRIIGATTLEEYRKYIEKDSALERRFQPVRVEEPSPENAVKILNGLRQKYEEHHKVVITDGAVDSAVNLSVRYLTGRFLPDKALDLIDEASSHVRIKASAVPTDFMGLSKSLNSFFRIRERKKLPPNRKIRL